MTRKNFFTCTVFMWFYASSFLVQTEIWNKAEVFSTWTTLFIFTECLNHMTSVNNEKHTVNYFFINDFILIFIMIYRDSVEFLPRLNCLKLNILNALQEDFTLETI